jgi:hypothetical protein
MGAALHVLLITAAYPASVDDPRGTFIRVLAEALVDDHVPVGDTVLSLFEARRSHLRNAVLEDSALLNWPLMRSVLGDGKCLPPDRMRYVLVNHIMFGYFAARGLEADCPVACLQQFRSALPRSGSGGCRYRTLPNATSGGVSSRFLNRNPKPRSRPPHRW